MTDGLSPQQHIHSSTAHRRRSREGDKAYIVFIDFVATFDCVTHKLIDKALKAAGATDKCHSVFRAIYGKATTSVRVAIYGKATTSVRVRTENGEETISRPFSIRHGVVQGDIRSAHMDISCQPVCSVQ
eukprot:SAG31_NODE_784_length_12112_cov_10.538666_11_plen_129_part_00